MKNRYKQGNLLFTKIGNDPHLEGSLYSLKAGELIRPRFLAHFTGCYRLKRRKRFYKGTWYICAKKRHPTNPEKGAKKKYQTQGTA